MSMSKVEQIDKHDQAKTEMKRRARRLRRRQERRDPESAPTKTRFRGYTK